MAKDNSQSDDVQFEISWAHRTNESLTRSLSVINALLARLVLFIGALAGFGFAATLYGDSDYAWAYILGGIVIGAIIGWIVAVILFGTLAVLLNIRELLSQIRDAVKDQERSPGSGQE